MSNCTRYRESTFLWLKLGNSLAVVLTIQNNGFHYVETIVP